MCWLFAAVGIERFSLSCRLAHRRKPAGIRLPFNQPALIPSRIASASTARHGRTIIYRINTNHANRSGQKESQSALQSLRYLAFNVGLAAIHARLVSDLELARPPNYMKDAFLHHNALFPFERYISGLMPADHAQRNRIGPSAEMVDLLKTVNRCGNAFHSRFQLEGQKLRVVA